MAMSSPISAFRTPKLTLLEAELVSRIDDTMRDRDITLTEAAQVMDLPQSDVSRFLPGDFCELPRSACAACSTLSSETSLSASPIPMTVNSFALSPSNLPEAVLPYTGGNRSRRLLHAIVPMPATRASVDRPMTASCGPS